MLPVLVLQQLWPQLCRVADQEANLKVIKITSLSKGENYQSEREKITSLRRVKITSLRRGKITSLSKGKFPV